MGTCLCVNSLVLIQIVYRYHGTGPVLFKFASGIWSRSWLSQLWKVHCVLLVSTPFSFIFSPSFTTSTSRIKLKLSYRAQDFLGYAGWLMILTVAMVAGDCFLLQIFGNPLKFNPAYSAVKWVSKHFQLWQYSIGFIYNACFFWNLKIVFWYHQDTLPTLDSSDWWNVTTMMTKRFLELVQTVLCGRRWCCCERRKPLTTRYFSLSMCPFNLIKI